MSQTNKPAIKSTEMFHEFVITYHPDNVTIPTRTIKFTFVNEKCEPSHIIDSLVKTMAEFNKNLTTKIFDENLKKQNAAHLCIEHKPEEKCCSTEKKEETKEEVKPTPSKYKPEKITEHAPYKHSPAHDMYNSLYGGDD